MSTLRSSPAACVDYGKGVPMASTRITPLSADAFRRTPWKNGGGVTIDIADAYRPGAAPGSWDGMIWRLGRTAIVAPGPFSDLSGFERLQIVIAGRGLVLETPDGEIDLRQPFTTVRYDGGTAVTSRLENGSVEVVNLIADRALCTIELRVAAAGETLMLAPGTHVVYAPHEAIASRIDGVAFDIDDGQALRLDGDDETELAVTRGRALLASIGLPSKA